MKEPIKCTVDGCSAPATQGAYGHRNELMLATCEEHNERMERHTDFWQGHSVARRLTSAHAPRTRQKTHIVGEIVAGALPKPRLRRRGDTRILTFHAGSVRDGAAAYRSVADRASELARLAVDRGLEGATVGEPYHRGQSEWLCDVVIPVA